jgi:hypothetical protein
MERRSCSAAAEASVKPLANCSVAAATRSDILFRPDTLPPFRLPFPEVPSDAGGRGVSPGVRRLAAGPASFVVLTRGINDLGRGLIGKACYLPKSIG